MENALQILQYAMEMEKKGQQFYNSFKDQIHNNKTKAIFENLVKAEEDHYNILAREYEKISKGESWSDPDSLALGNNTIFQSAQEEEKLDGERLSSAVSDLAIMRMAYLIEHDFAEFYRKALEKTEDENGRKILQALITMEEDHERFFYQEYKSLMESTWHDAAFAPF